MASYPALDLRYAPGPGAGILQDFLHAELDDFEPLAIHEHETGDGWRVFFRTPAQRDGARAALMSEFGNALTEVSPIEIDDEDWARRSQEALTAVRVGRIVVAPPWDPSLAAVRGPLSDQPIVVVIDPSMGFGTGHHATTRLCLELLQEGDNTGQSVIDVGTGSGVLAIAAAKLGAARVTAVDHDPDALINARENVERNAVQAVVDVREVDLSVNDLPAADLVLANLTGAVLQRGAARLRALVTSGGLLIVSGFSPGEFGDVRTALGATAVQQRQDGDWMAALLCWQPADPSPDVVKSPA